MDQPRLPIPAPKMEALDLHSALEELERREQWLHPVQALVASCLGAAAPLLAAKQLRTRLVALDACQVSRSQLA